ncbi:MAG: hypothetical protein DMD67_10980 [Gemmatimonadetes bacterium]|nr:MAG: hypothetical protein DMD67_10980 [Gemmatimonadota bacterium]
MVEERTLGPDRGARVARGGPGARGRTTGDRRRHRWLRRGSGGLARATRRHPDGAGRRKCLSGSDHALARASRTPGAPEVFTLGNPVRPRAPEEGGRLAVLADLGLAPARPTLLVFGGSQGARAINYAVAGALERRLLDGMNVLWGTGEAHAAAFIGYAVTGRVVVRGFFDPMTTAYRAADLVVSRAGAMTLAELCAWGKPSILVPLPTAAADHQTQNARALAAAGAAIYLAETELTPHSLAERVRGLLDDPGRLQALSTSARARGHPDAAREIVSKILTLTS